MHKFVNSHSHLHFVGMGGIGMSGIAEIMHHSGFCVQGSDLVDNYNMARLRHQGIGTFIGHAAEHVGGAQVLVINSAIDANNPELLEAQRLKLPIMHRSEMLAEIMRSRTAIAVAGTHGKTTTTSLISWLLEVAGFDPTVVNGGVIHDFHSNAKLGKSEWAVVETDESDGSFANLPSTIAVVTNINSEHLEHYGSFESLYQAFKTFVKNTPFYGFIAACVDHSTVSQLVEQTRDRKIITYGIHNPEANVKGYNLRNAVNGITFDVKFNDNFNNYDSEINDIFLPMLGEHNVQNALAAITVARGVGIMPAHIKQALKSFGGVKRRFTNLGQINGVTIIDDYAHHPVEIKAVLKAAQQFMADAVYIVIEPHRYTRLNSLFEEFATAFEGVNQVFVTNLYEASEQPFGHNSDTLCEHINKHSHNALRLTDENLIDQLVLNNTFKNALLIYMGAGNSSVMASNLVARLKFNAQPANDNISNLKNSDLKLSLFK